MKKLNLEGAWILKKVGEDKEIPGQLPGCQYLDLMASGHEDPFWGENEKEASKLAKADYEYSREFEISEDFLGDKYVELVACGIDTLCTITVNGRKLAKTNNISRTWRFDIKPYLKAGKNSISLLFANPYNYFEKKQKERPLAGIANEAKGSSYLRKVPSHFGWDWGPVLPPAGVIGKIKIESYSCRIKEVRVRQEHKGGKVTLYMSASVVGEVSRGSFIVQSPKGECKRYSWVGGSGECSAAIKNPLLWWCNGLGEQPLYKVSLEIDDINGQAADKAEKNIGLRTIKLDTSEDKLGNQFRFIINGVPIFVKGANWIPSDSFVTRTTEEILEFYIKSAKQANMNLLRVWGGGMYESDDFYNLCDKYGILVWQDFMFACGAYPLFDKDFVENVRQEVHDNVKRIRHHASLALWCGNNENEIMRVMWKKQKEVDESNVGFYHKILRKWVDELDGQTDYWPGSPSSGILGKRVHSMKKGEIRGDTHLWQIWHGMLPIEGFRKLPTRFCSEYGMESMPSMYTIRMFTDSKNPSLFDPVMQAHQKSHGGNEKILYYLLAKYRNPKNIEDFIYLSQIVQADTIRFATDCWRRGIGRQNGAVYWQYNDCWPVASWSGIDYGRQFKAVQYRARHFNKPLCLSNDYFENRAEIYVVNEYPHNFEGEVRWRLCRLDGTEISCGKVDVKVQGVSALRIKVLKFKEILMGCSAADAVLYVTLEKDGKIADEKNWLLVPDKKARLRRPSMKVKCGEEKGEAVVTVGSDTFARYVFIQAQGITEPWSDNFFDIPAGESRSVRVRLPDGMTAAELESKIRLRSLADVEPRNSAFVDRLLRVSMIFKKRNYLTWIMIKLFLNKRGIQ